MTQIAPTTRHVFRTNALTLALLRIRVAKMHFAKQPDIDQCVGALIIGLVIPTENVTNVG